MAKKAKEEEVKKAKKKVKAEKPSKKAAKPAKADKKAKTADKSSKAEKKTKKGDALAAARAAKGKTKAKKSKAATKNIIFKAKNPELKPAWHEIRIKTEKDGLLAGQIQARRFVGAIEADKDERKIADLSQYDMQTLIGIQSRLAGATFHPTGRPNKAGVPSRLAPNAEYILHARLAVTKEGALKANVSKVFQEETNSKGRVKQVELDKKDPFVRKIRRVNKYLAAAFVHAVMPPKPERKSRRAKAEEE